MIAQVDPEYAAARNSAAVFDLSDRAAVELTGPDAPSLLHNLCTNDIKNLAAGRGCEFFLTTNKARVVAHGFAHRLLPAEPLVLWLDLAPGTAAKVTAHLNHFVVSEQVEIFDRTGTLSQLYLCGPQAPNALAAVVPGLPPLEHLQHVSVNSLRIVRHDRLGLPGYDLVLPASDAESAQSRDREGADAPNLLDRLVKSGSVRAGLATFNVLRIEAGIPMDGIDIDAERFVVEVGRTQQAICYTKGCYLGQEPIVMARDRGHLNRLLVGVVSDAPEPLPQGTKLMHDGKEAGHVTTSVKSPLMGAVIALAYIKRENQQPGTKLQIGEYSAVVTTLPFAGGGVARVPPDAATIGS
jgi:tRNA-modifying protein YgfZ